MLAVLFDTNIYGRIAEDPDSDVLVERLKRDSTFAVLNFRLIRNELRSIPKILPLYDRLVSRRIIDETNDMKELAKAFFAEYKTLGGKQGRKKMMTDFKIVACATLKNCDIVYSEDKKTLKHPIARQAYGIVAVREHRRPPSLYSYDDLRRSYF